MTCLSMHVLDLVHGGPAAGVAVRLLREATVLAEAATGAGGGHCHVPLLASSFGYSTYRGS